MNFQQMASIVSSICFVAGGLLLGMAFMLRSHRATRARLEKMESMFQASAPPAQRIAA